MTSTSTFSGDSSSKPSSRVLRPPGGGSSIIFGGDPDTSSYKRNEPAVVRQMEPKAELTKSSMEAGRCIGGVCSIGGQQRTEARMNHVPGPAPAPAPASGHTNMRGNKTCGYNPITGEAYPNTATATPAAPTERQQVTTSISVRQPPGGASTRPW